MITEKTRNWLWQSGLFKTVLAQGSYVEATHTLRANIIALYGDFIDTSAPTATIQIRFFLIDAKNESIVFDKDYESTSPLRSKNAEDLIDSLDLSLIKILTNLENDLIREFITSKTKL